MQCFAMIKSGNIILEEVLGGPLVYIFVQIMQVFYPIVVLGT